MDTNLPVHVFIPNPSKIPASYDLQRREVVHDDDTDPLELRQYLKHGGCFPHPSITNPGLTLPEIGDSKKTPKLPRKPLLT